MGREGEHPLYRAPFIAPETIATAATFVLSWAGGEPRLGPAGREPGDVDTTRIDVLGGGDLVDHRVYVVEIGRW